jgi:peptidoglycan/LPS O-acetylase OafA/YrhL
MNQEPRMLVVHQLNNQTSLNFETAPSWRRDVQGLRALAVIMVVLFHSGLPIHGGFIGVDVFFVISGFVITSMLLRELNANKEINLKKFYWRRFKRLFPAFAIMLCTTLVLSSIFLSPFGNQRNVFETALGALLISANVAIAKTTGDYFDSESKINPLLHTWSLAVEEQFYFVFPLIFICVWTISHEKASIYRNLKRIVLFFTIASFAILISMSHNVFSFPGAKAMFGFYSPIVRAWEFGAGALVALLIEQKGKVSNKINRINQSVGIVLLLTASFVISESNMNPGVVTLLPIAATVLLISSGITEVSWVSKFLTSKPLVLMGDWSYSFYLWHWPFVVFANILFPNSLSITILAVIISLAPALLSYYFVEDPIRRCEAKDLPRRIIVVCAVTLFCLVGFGFGLKGEWWVSWTGNTTPQESRIAFTECTDMPFNPTMCTFGESATGEFVLLVGDSQAYSFAEGVIEAAASLGLSTVISSRSGCPFSGFDTSGAKPLDCPTWQREMLNYAKNKNPRVVLIANRSTGYTNEGWRTMVDKLGGVSNSNKVLAYSQGISSVVKEVTESGTPVIILQNIPEPNMNIFQPTLFQKLFPNFIKTSFDARESLSLRAPVALAERSILRQFPNSFLFDPVADLCVENICKLFKDSKPLYSDNSHLSKEGSLLLSPSLRGVILLTDRK